MNITNVLAVILCATFLVGAVMAQSPQTLLEGAAAFGDWRADSPGLRRKISAKDLPAPLTSEPVASGPQAVERPEGVKPRTLPGFSAAVFVDGLASPRVIRVAPNGDIFVAEIAAGRLRVLRPDPSGAKVARSEIFAEALDRPHGVAFYPPGPEPRYVYVALSSKVLRFPYRIGDMSPSGKAQTIATLPGGGNHWTRDIVFSPDGGTLYVAVGSRSNVAEGFARLTPEETQALEKNSGVGASGGPELDRADVLAFDPEGGNERVFATGLRNCSGLSIRPGSDELWCVVNERDMLGDDLPPDYATHVKQHGFYGWPWYYIGSNVDPRHAGARPDLADKVLTPDVLIQAHSAPLGISFYDGAQFPAEYRGDAFVALHGSWNRARRTGYKVVRLKFKDGAPTGEYEDFLTGFVADDARVWGRPVDVAIGLDGALFVSDDANGTIWRISYASKSPE